jgi:hypothetical protein
LFHAAVFFLLGHEIAHITRGHVDYLASNSGTSLISEIEFNREDEEANIERQAIETDADRRSIWSCVASIELTLATPNLANAPWLPSRRLGLTDLIFDWAFAINSLFRLFGDKRFNPGDLETEVYPPHPLRRVIATNIAYTGLVFREPGRKGIVLPVLRDAMVYTDLAFARILGEEVRADGLDVAWSPLGKEHHERLLNESLRTLNDRLAPFAFEPDVVQLSDEQPRIPGTAAPPG